MGSRVEYSPFSVETRAGNIGNKYRNMSETEYAVLGGELVV